MLWWLDDDERFGQEAADLLASPDNEVLLSAAVVWEIAIKRSLGKLDAPDDLAARLLGAGALPLAITLDHARAVEALPLHHRDPFDRILIAQAGLERCAIVTSDGAFAAYDVDLIW